VVFEELSFRELRMTPVDMVVESLEQLLACCSPSTNEEFLELSLEL